MQNLRTEILKFLFDFVTKTDLTKICVDNQM